MVSAHQLSAERPWLLGSIAVLGAGVLCGLVAISPPHVVYDEGLHLRQVGTLADSGLWAMLTTPSTSAAGPVYPFLHYALSPLTDLSAPAVRVLNLLLTAATIALLALVLARYGYRNVWQRAGLLLAVPMVWVCAGMALTEIPPIFFVTAAVAVLAPLLPLRPEREPPERGYWLPFFRRGAPDRPRDPVTPDLPAITRPAPSGCRLPPTVPLASARGIAGRRPSDTSRDPDMGRPGAARPGGRGWRYRHRPWCSRLRLHRDCGRHTGTVLLPARIAAVAFRGACGPVGHSRLAPPNRPPTHAVGGRSDPSVRAARAGQNPRRCRVDRARRPCSAGRA